MVKKKNQSTKLYVGVITVFVVILVINIYTLVVLASIGSGSISQTTSDSVLPTGMPAVYGSELGINYDDISQYNPGLADAVITKLGQFDYVLNPVGEDKQRYIAITSQISCEYCCGAESIIFPNGEAACGCAHSYAMRGLAKFLVMNHPEMSNEDILTELAKWKTLFFPGQMTAKAQVLADQGIEFSYINLGSNKYRDIERGATSGSGMVGGC